MVTGFKLFCIILLMYCLRDIVTANQNNLQTEM